jgi:isoleucyl-tRNA synthetase
MVAAGDQPSATVGGGTGVIVLDVDLTPELEVEGRARDLVRMVQQARRDADLAVTDRIELRIVADREWIDAARTYEDLLRSETLASDVLTDDSGSETPAITVVRR